MSSWAPTPPSPDRSSARDQVLKAARDCFLRAGVRKTTMEDVARTAGTSRQTVYKMFGDRRELIVAAIEDRVAEIADALVSRQWDATLDAFVKRAVAIVEDMRRDAELAVLLGDGSPITLHEVLWRGPLRQRALKDWTPWLREARRTGLIRTDITDEDLWDWLQTVLASIVLRPETSLDYERMMIEEFLLQSIRPKGPS